MEWRYAADRGHVEAMYALALLAGDSGGRMRYLRQAAALGHAPAGHALGYDAFMNGDHDAAALRG